MNTRLILSINLRYYRKQLKLSQEKFAELVGSNLKYIHDLEKGKRNVSIDMIEKIATAVSEELHEDITVGVLTSYNDKHDIDFKRVDEKV